jgi:hypothetical protein
LPSAANLLHEERGLGKAVDPPLRVREDWWVFEKKNYNPLAFTQKTLIFAQNLKNRRNYGNIE